nr:S41 family peptidase [uncultured Bacteroides sp.]
MKKYTYLLLLLSEVIFTTIFTSCLAEDRTLEYRERTDVNNWVYNEMLNAYLWYDGISEADKLNFYATPGVFFKTLLSSKENKNSSYYSTIDSIDNSSSNESLSYGFDFVIDPTDSTSYARVLYVLPDSPASEAGLKRGDLIIAFNGLAISKTNYTQMLTGNELKLMLGTFGGEKTDSITLSAARKVSDDPILASNVLISNSGNTIGYLMYNHFSPGPNNNAYDYTYDNELRQLFASFKSQNVTDFVLDLRYNTGGYISCCQLLSTMLAPSSALGQTFCKIEYNDKYPEKTVYTFDSDSIKGGANLNLSHLYVLVSDYTAATAELLINGLKPYMGITLIGTTTKGNNLVTRSIKNDTYNWVINPVVGKLYNSKDESEYSSGFTPDVKQDEFKDYSAFKKLGDKNETLLKEALALINGASLTKSTRTKSISTVLNIKQSSLDRKKTNGAWLAPIKR